ncbi:MAG: bifunctional methylenetetrahydrofolate dehydrogenase/methenyltetrahydrofolate cyclohydrolase FolD [Deltaproteobacteria bacterium]|jgi:methylenetetrahydrofolate dehydrogenase (NADP+)/methenyltetrahydrofolate cyclohydrolase|nr:bifunctional methylenetetrahydrofolate dehydrogenase/methenyltetrahydrofolate cyclohydrolase FolD [Deltaproteobacteria bacterium]
MQILDGKATAASIRAELKEETAAMAGRFGRKPGLAVILAGEDPASQVYVRNKEKACAEVGITSTAFRLPPEVSQTELEELIDSLNDNPDVDGILLQLPLPKGLDSQRLLERISPAKDVDGFHPENMGRLTLGLPGFRPCTPAGVITLLNRYGIKAQGKKAVVLGRSNIVGKPLALMLASTAGYGNATVTICHSRTPNLQQECLEADILLAALGRPEMITADMVKPGAVVVDVGINRTEKGLCGDCSFEAISLRASAMTPVPGGVGPMTIAMLLYNTLRAFKLHNGLDMGPDIL